MATSDYRVVELNNEDSDAYKNRLQWVRRVAMELGDLAVKLPEYSVLLNESDAVDVELGKRVTTLLAQMLSDSWVQTTFALTTMENEEAHWLRGEDLTDLSYSVGRIRALFLGLNDLRSINSHFNNLSKHLRAALRRSNAFNTLGPDGISKTIEALHPIQAELLRFDDEMDEQRRQRQEAAVAQAEEARSAAKRASGSTGQNVMSTFYAALGVQESQSANRFRRLTVQFAIGGGAAALLFLLLPLDFFGSQAGADAWVRLVQKAVFLGGVFALAGYFAKQAHQHRSLANWAHALAVQLQTFEAYLAAVDDPQVKDELIKSFAGRAFGEHPALKGEQPVTSSAALVDTAASLAAKFTSSAK